MAEIRPLIWTSPEEGLSVPVIIFRRVLLPAPFCPTIPTASPGVIEKCAAYAARDAYGVRPLFWGAQGGAPQNETKGNVIFGSELKMLTPSCSTFFYKFSVATEKGPCQFPPGSYVVNHRQHSPSRVSRAAGSAPPRQDGYPWPRNRLPYSRPGGHMYHFRPSYSRETGKQQAGNRSADQTVARPSKGDFRKTPHRMWSSD